MNRKIVLIAVIGLLSLPNLALSQGVYASQARDNLEDAYYSQLADRGFDATGELIEGSLGDSEDEDVWITLYGRGEYAIVAACDEDCSDIDLHLYDEDGNSIDSDMRVSQDPVVEVTTSRTEDYRVNVKMYSCGTEPCYYALRVYRRGGGGGRDVSYARQARDNLDDAYDSQLADRGFRATGELIEGSLDDSEDEDVWITLNGRGTYAIAAACDEDCSDIDLHLYDEDGNSIDSDMRVSQDPVVEVTTSRTEDYRVNVKMYNCDTEPCYYAMRVYRRGGGGRGRDAGGSFAQRTRRALDRAFEDGLADRGYFESGDMFEGSLDEMEEEDVWISLRRNQSYAILAVCDEDCSDIDLYLYDEDGDQIDTDTSIDQEPVVRVTPRRNADYRVRVRMYSCDTEPCYYAFGVYER